MDERIPVSPSTPRFGCLVVLVLFAALAGLVACSPDAPSRSPPVAASDDHCVVGSSKGKTYHRSSCEWARKVSPRNLVRFAGEEEAAKKGYGPCRTCFPK